MGRDISTIIWENAKTNYRPPLIPKPKHVLPLPNVNKMSEETKIEFLYQNR